MRESNKNIPVIFFLYPRTCSYNREPGIEAPVSGLTNSRWDAVTQSSVPNPRVSGLFSSPKSHYIFHKSSAVMFFLALRQWSGLGVLGGGSVWRRVEVVLG